MTKLQELELAKSIISAVQADLIDPVTGEFKKQPDYSDDVKLGADIEAAYKAQGGVVPDNVDKVLAGVAAVVKILGA